MHNNTIDSGLPRVYEEKTKVKPIEFPFVPSGQDGKPVFKVENWIVEPSFVPVDESAPSETGGKVVSQHLLPEKGARVFILKIGEGWMPVNSSKGVELSAADAPIKVGYQKQGGNLERVVVDFREGGVKFEEKEMMPLDLLVEITSSAENLAKAIGNYLQRAAALPKDQPSPLEDHVPADMWQLGEASQERPSWDKVLSAVILYLSFRKDNPVATASDQIHRFAKLDENADFILRSVKVPGLQKTSLLDYLESNKNLDFKTR